MNRRFDIQILRYLRVCETFRFHTDEKICGLKRNANIKDVGAMWTNLKKMI